MLAFQSARGLHPTGECDAQTWAALVEAGWALGDRLLHLTAPHLRGDDVTALQDALNHLGFDCGRPDGILGPATARALTDFQRHSGLTVDGICGVRTVRMLDLLARQSGTGPGVASVRESVALDAPCGLAAARIVVGQFGGLSSVTRLVVKQLRIRGATVISTDEHDAAAQAAAANRFGATAYVGFEGRTDDITRITYFAVPTFESLGGRALATGIADALTPLLPDVEVVGMRLPVLRETRMPAVLCSFGALRHVVDEAAAIATSVAAVVEAWVEQPV